MSLWIKTNDGGLYNLDHETFIRVISTETPDEIRWYVILSSGQSVFSGTQEECKFYMNRLITQLPMVTVTMPDSVSDYSNYIPRQEKA